MFIAALSNIAKTWRQARCPSTDEWIKKMWYTYAMEYYPSIKKEKNWVSWSDVDEPRACHMERSKSEIQNKHHILTRIYGM